MIRYWERGNRNLSVICTIMTRITEALIHKCRETSLILVSIMGLCNATCSFIQVAGVLPVSPGKNFIIGHWHYLGNQAFSPFSLLTMLESLHNSWVFVSEIPQFSQCLQPCFSWCRWCTMWTSSPWSVDSSKTWGRGFYHGKPNSPSRAGLSPTWEDCRGRHGCTWHVPMAGKSCFVLFCNFLHL